MKKKHIPYLLIAFRLLCAPTMIWLAMSSIASKSNWIVLLMYLGLISDILDGIVARKLEVATKLLRRMDSQTDLLFWLSIGISAWQLEGEQLSQHKWEIILLFITEISCYAVSFIRFGKETCTHAWLSKLFGLSMLTAFTAIIGFGITGAFYYTALVIGYLSHLDRIVITLLIPSWTHDIPSFYHANLLRKGKTFKKYSLFN